MAIKYTVEEHAVAFVTKMLASTYGKHIYNIELTADRDNGNVVAKGDFIELDLYKDKASTDVAGVILDQAANGNWYVEVTEPGDGLLVYQVPLNYHESPRDLSSIKTFYNEKGDVVRGYEMAKGDVIELSAKAFDGTPEKGKTLTVADYKWKVVTTAAPSTPGGNG